MPLNRIEPAAKARQNGGLIARPGADFENSVPVCQFQSLSHEANNQRLTDCLTAGNGQGSVGPGLI